MSPILGSVALSSRSSSAGEGEGDGEDQLEKLAHSLLLASFPSSPPPLPLGAFHASREFSRIDSGVLLEESEHTHTLDELAHPDFDIRSVEGPVEAKESDLEDWNALEESLVDGFVAAGPDADPDTCQVEMSPDGMRRAEVGPAHEFSFHRQRARHSLTETVRCSLQSVCSIDLS